MWAKIPHIAPLSKRFFWGAQSRASALVPSSRCRGYIERASRENAGPFNDAAIFERCSLYNRCMDHHTVAAVSITGTCLDVLGSLYLAYDLLGGQHGPLRLLTRAVTYSIVFGVGYGIGLGFFFGF